MKLYEQAFTVIVTSLLACGCDGPPTATSTQTAEVKHVLFTGSRKDAFPVFDADANFAFVMDLSEPASIKVDLNCPVHGWFEYSATGDQAFNANWYFHTNSAVKVECITYHKPGVGMTTRHEVRF